MKFPPRKNPQNRHCEEGRRPDAAIQSPALPSLDCFAPLAMTAWVNALHHNGARAFMNLGQHSPLEKMLVDQPTLTFGPLRLKKPANELLVGLARPSSSRAKKKHAERTDGVSQHYHFPLPLRRSPPAPLASFTPSRQQAQKNRPLCRSGFDEFFNPRERRL